LAENVISQLSLKPKINGLYDGHGRIMGDEKNVLVALFDPFFATTALPHVCCREMETKDFS